MSAEMSLDGKYRYFLSRYLGMTPQGGRLLFTMLNPSTADAEENDSTIRRCISFAKREGFAHLEVVNLYAYRATDPKKLRDVEDPAGPGNLKRIRKAAKKADKIVVAWGAGIHHGLEPQRTVASTLAALGHPTRKLYCFGQNKDRSPKHPLYLPEVTQLQLFRP